MSFLDLYQGDQQQALRIQPGEGHDLPATFGESFHAAWDYGRLFQQSVAGENSRQEALQDYIDDVRQKTGKDPAAGVDWTMTAPGVGPVSVPSTMALEQVNGAVDKINAERPSDQTVPTLSADDLEQKAVAKSRAAGRALADVEGREHSGLGTFLGGAAASATDPINVLALPIAPETGSFNILSAALRWGAVAGVSQAAIEGFGGGYREEVQPGYAQSGAPAANVLEAFGSGALIGGGTRFLGNAWTRLKTGAWPTSVKDAGNLIESEANVLDHNVYEGAGAEAAHRDAMAASVDQVLKEQPVDVSQIITPDIEAKARDLTWLMEHERSQSLPAFNERQIALTSEEAGLRARDAELAGNVPEITEAHETAADRLNRLQAVEAQLQTATGDARRALMERRDQILVDTTPEELQAGAAPIEQARQIEAERQQIATRLNEIEAERAQTRAAAMGVPQANIGQREPWRPAEVPTFEVPERVAPPSPEQMRATLESPEHIKALEADVNREQVADVSRAIPVAKDEKGNLVYRSIDSMQNEVEAYRKIAEQIGACAAPAQEQPSNG